MSMIAEFEMVQKNSRILIVIGGIRKWLFVGVPCHLSLGLGSGLKFIDIGWFPLLFILVVVLYLFGCLVML